MPKDVPTLVAKSDLIVEAVVVSARPADQTAHFLPPDSPLVTVLTAYDFDVKEEFKTHLFPRAIVEVIREGGERDRGTYIESRFDPEFPLFEVGERYLLFLRVLPSIEGAYVMATDTPDSAFLVTNDRVMPRGRAPLAQEIGASLKSHIVTLLRQHGRHK